MVVTLCILHSVEDYLLDDGTLFLLVGSLLLHGCEVVVWRVDRINWLEVDQEKYGGNFFIKR
jgi:hypothetical protein